MKIVHLSDLHIRNYRYHEEYKYSLDDLYNQLNQIKPDLIIFAGDLGHTKLQISPNFVQMASSFIKNLSQISETHIILGNHDLNLKNMAKLDVLSPIIELINSNQLHFHKFTTKYSFNNFDFHFLSLLDKDNWEPPTNSNVVNIAVAHASIEGALTDSGYAMSSGEIDLDFLFNFDYSMLGDIHVSNQEMDEDGRIRYSGNMIQSSFGEQTEKGFLLWNIEDKNNFSVEFFPIKHQNPFYTINIGNGEKLPKINIKKNAHIRVLYNENITPNLLNKAINIIQAKYTPKSLVQAYDQQSVISPVDLLEIPNYENLRDASTQEDLIKKFLHDTGKEVKSETLQEIFKLNSFYNIVDSNIKRNIIWQPTTMKWDYLFNFGENNSIDFTKASGIIGIFGENYIGKSAIVDTLLYTLFNTTSKEKVKNLELINENQDSCNSSIDLWINDKRRIIHRRSEKYYKNLKGKTTLEAKTEVDLYKGDWEPINGDSRQKTDDKIRQNIGTVEDFFLTTMATQFDFLQFLKEGSTKRKEIFARFLDLDIFEIKYKQAKDDRSEISVQIKNYPNKEKLLESIVTTRAEYKRVNQKIDQYISSINFVESQKLEIVQKLKDLGEKLKTIDTKQLYNIPMIQEQIEIKKNNLQSLNNKLQKLNKEKENLNKNKIVCEQILNDAPKTIEEDYQNYLQCLQDLEKNKIQEKNINKKENLLKDIPCDLKFPQCKFIYDAVKTIEKKEFQQNSNIAILQKLELLNQQITHEVYSQFISKRDELPKIIQSISVSEAQLSLTLSNIASNNKDLEKLLEKEKSLISQKKLIKSLHALQAEQKKYEKELAKFNTNIYELKQKQIKAYKESGRLEEQKNNLENTKNALEILLKKKHEYDLYIDCVHSNGIPYMIIQDKLPIINNEISKTLKNIADFEVTVEADNNKLEVYIKHPKYNKRTLAMGSGAEKTIAALMIRLALLKISNLPKTNFLILDEPGTALDSKNLEGFIRALFALKDRFDFIILISHLEALKDVADIIIDIDKDKKGYANVNF